MVSISTIDWKARWIGAPKKLSSGKWKLPPLLFRKEISISKKLLKRVVYNGLYKFQIGFNSRDIAGSVDVNIHGKLTPKIVHVTLQPEKLVYHIGGIIDLKSKNKWIKSDVNPARECLHATADNIIEAVNNDGSFVNLANKHVRYQSSNPLVMQVL